MKARILTVRKRRVSGLGQRKRPLLTGAIYLAAGSVGKRFVVLSVHEWKSLKKEVARFNSLIRTVNKEVKRRS